MQIRECKTAQESIFATGPHMDTRPKLEDFSQDSEGAGAPYFIAPCSQKRIYSVYLLLCCIQHAIFEHRRFWLPIFSFPLRVAPATTP